MAKKIIDKMVDALGAPRTTNVVFETGLAGKKADSATKGISLGGRRPQTPADITHASRNISNAELNDIKRKGYAVADPNSKFNKRRGTNDKWWSAADKDGPYGRPWKGNADTTIRAKIKDVKGSRAIRATALEAKNPTTGVFEPIKPARGALAKTVAKNVARRVSGPVGAALTGYDIGTALYNVPAVQNTIAKGIDRVTGLEAKNRKLMQPTTPRKPPKR